MASPESMIAGAAIPPIAPLVEGAVALVLDEAADEVAVAFDEVEFEKGAETTVAFVASGASTVTVPVTIEQADSEAEATTAGAVVCAFAPDEATAPCVCTAATLPALAETESVVSEITVPVTVAVTGTVTVAVTV